MNFEVLNTGNVDAEVAADTNLFDLEHPILKKTEVLNTDNIDVEVVIGTNLSDLEHPILKKLEDVKNVFFVIDNTVINLKVTEDILKCFENRPGIFKYKMSAQKQSKTFQTVLEIFSMLERSNFPRDGVVVAIGGGVIGDIAGFVASCWYRGVQLIHIPTTLLAMVDSCFGGKTAVNFRSTINAVGSYHQPTAIYIDTAYLSSLPQRDLSSGLGEILKYGLIESPNILRMLQNAQFGEVFAKNAMIEGLIFNCLKIKHDYVCSDVHEQSKRLALNFGHTIGHAIETASQFNGCETLRHGEAVALGMRSALFISTKIGDYNIENIRVFDEICENLSLPTRFKYQSLYPTKKAFLERCMSLVMNDKKRKSDGLRMILLNSDADWTIETVKDKELLRYGIEQII